MSDQDEQVEVSPEVQAEGEWLEAQRRDRSKPANVIAALAKVMEELPGIGKNENSSQGYQYRGIEAITAEAQTLLGKYGVVFVPEVLERTVKDFISNGKPWTEDQLKVIYHVYGPGGVKDKIVVGPLYGLGRDNSDKGSNKSMTQCFKYALIQTLCIGDSKDDADKDVARESDAIQVRRVMAPDVQAVADQWPDVDAFDRAHHAYTSAVGKLDQGQRGELKAWKGQNKFGVWMDPDQFDATMGAIRTLRRNEHIMEPEPPESSETPEQGQPPTETPETNEPPVETPEPPHEPSHWEGELINSMNARRLMEILKSLGLPVQGKVDQLRHNLRQHVRAQSVKDGEEAAELCEFCGENPCVCAPAEELKAQVEADTEPVQTVETADSEDPGRPF